MNLYDFEQNFGNYYPPKILVDLLDFQNKYYNYAKGFGLFGEGTFAIQHLSITSEFLERLLCFANDEKGSTFAFWDDSTKKDIKEMPIIVIADKDGIHIVAENIKQLLQLLSCDIAISVNRDKAYFNKDIANHTKSLHHGIFIQWLKENYQIEPNYNPNEIIATAQNKYKTDFNNWLQNFVKQKS